MKVNETPTAQGRRLVLLDGEHETLKAEVSGDSSAPGVTVYWRGRVHLEQIASFFAKNCPPASNPAFGALVFQAHSRLRIDEISDPWKLVGGLPSDACFVRLEHAAAGADPSPDFITWSRIDLADTPLDDPAPDYIGVSALPAWLNKIAQPLAKFISDTHVAHLRQGAALDRVNEILHRVPAS